MSKRRKHKRDRGNDKSVAILEQTQNDDRSLEVSPKEENVLKPEPESVSGAKAETESGVKPETADTNSAKPPREARFFAYVITGGPILAQIWDAFQHPFANDKTPQRTIVFDLEERDYKKKGSPIVHRSGSILRMNIIGIEHDGNEDALKRQNHLVITGQIAADDPSTLPCYIDGIPFRNGTMVQIFYNLSARCGAILRIDSYNGNGLYAPFVPGHLEYIPPSIF